VDFSLRCTVDYKWVTVTVMDCVRFESNDKMSEEKKLKNWNFNLSVKTEKLKTNQNISKFLSRRK